ncbi:MAG: SMC-Scp complex subunit ScpB [Halothiobacillaceae bacterium]
MGDPALERVADLLEAVLVSAGGPVPESRLLDALGPEGVDAKVLQAALDRLDARYADRMIELARTAGGWQVRTRPAAAAVLARLEPTRPQKYSRAVLETLALIAWRQPVTRGDIEAVRGVSVNPAIVRTLVERGWVEVVGRRERPGRPELLGTTRQFLDDFGLRSLSDLPDFETFSGQGDALDV